MLIDKALQQSGSGLFYYSPKHIRSLDKPVPGYRIEAGEFVPTEANIPRVNGNWTYGTRKLMEQGIGYQPLIDWSRENSVEIYVPLEFSELAANKLETYRIVSRFDIDLHPYTEPYRQSHQQLQHFIDSNEIVFLKPRAGNKGDQIISLRRKASGFRIKYFAKGKQHEEKTRTSKEAHELIRKLTEGTMRYVIQQGVNSLRLDNRVFDLRVIMLFDGKRWDWVHEARLSAADSDLSNVSQGGSSIETEALLIEVAGNDAANAIMNKLKQSSFELAASLDSLHPNALMEVAFDFVLDTDAELHLVEINTKPGLASIGFSHSLDRLNPEEERLFERWVYPHTDSLARFLLSKA